MKLTRSKVALLILSLAGFFDSSYLTILHYKNLIPPCIITTGCETVLTSRFATILGIPISIFGSFFFLALIFLLLLGLNKYFKWLNFAGVGIAIVLLYLQAVVLRAYCQYCLLVEAIIFAILIITLKSKEFKQK